ncbi:MAG TPA: RHS repeat-associated core domain-containing protein [Planctomycetota bacterium]|jgi:RHS repeat-associated protein|nr:RHS repeat-associated core domain-containing protein [Planctomycetota bacterium]
MNRKSRILSYVTSALMLLHPSAVYAASRTSTFTAASPQGSFQNPATTNHFGRLAQGGARHGGAGGSCPTCPGGTRSGGCATCGGGASASHPEAPCPTCPGGSRAAGCPDCPNGGGLEAGDCPTCGRGPNLKVAGCTKCGEPEGLFAPGGEFYYSRTDLVVPGVGLDFRMCRIHRSGIMYDGPLGKKWEFCHNVRLTEYIVSIGEAIDLTTAKWVGMGREDNFSSQGSGFTNPTGWFGTLTKPSSSEYKFVEPQGLTWRFEADGAGGWFRLLEKKDRNGNRLAYYYDSGSKLTRVRDTLDRDFTFTYDGNGRIVTATDFGSPARSVVYGYDSSGRLTSVRTPTVDAEGTEDDFTSGKTTLYTYDSNDRMVTVQNPQGSSVYLINSYDGNGKLTAQRAGPSGSDYAMTYDGTNRKVTVTDREGNKTVHWYDTSNRITKVDIRGTSLSETPKTYQFAYGSNDLITKVTLPRGNLIESTFDSSGNLLTRKLKTDAGDSGLATIFTCTTDFNQISTITDPEGRLTDRDFDASGNLTKVTMPTVTSPSGISTTDKNGNSINDGVITSTYTFTSNGQVKTVIDPRGTTTSYDYSLVNSLTAYRTKQTIDSAGLNLTRQWAYDQFGNVTSATDGENKTTSYVVNELNQVLKVTNPLGFVTKYHYDANDNVTKTEVENDTEVGNTWFVTDYQYDLLNNVTKTIQDVDSTNRITTTYGYDKSERLTKVTKPAGNEVVTIFDERDLVVTRTRKAASSSDDSSEIFVLDDNANVVTQKDGRGNATIHGYELYDRRTTTTGPLGHFVVLAYDKNSNLTKSSRKNGAGALLSEETRYVDEVNRVWKTEELAKDSAGTNLGDGQRTTTLWRDELGAVLETTDESGSVRSAIYDKAGRAVTTKDALASGQNKVYTTYDKRGLVVTRISDEKSQDTGVEPDRTIQTLYEYDSAGRLTKETNQNGDYRTTSLNKRNFVRDVVDENGKKQIWRYDELGRVLTQVQELVANGTTFTDDVTTEFFYDANSRLVTMRGWNSTTGTQDTIRSYDNLDRVITTTYPDAFKYLYTYDKADNPITVIDPNGSTIVGTFDASNRRTQVDITRATGVEGVTKETFAYDGLDRVTNAYNEINPGTLEFKTEVKFVYNTLALVEKETLVTNGYNSNNGRDTSYTYDAEGRVLTLSYPDATAVTYTYDANDRLDVISRGTTVVCDYAFAGPLRPIKKDKPGTLSTYKYDVVGRVTEILHKKDSNANSLFKVAYGYDKTINPEYADLQNFDNSNGRITSGIDDEGQQYYYDNAYRLTKAFRDIPTSQITTKPPTTYSGKYEYAYDVSGNRTTRKVNDEVDTTYSHDKTNALTSITGDTFTYDKNGNGTDHRDGRFSWYDYRNRRVRINNDGVDPTTKACYDALGRRVQKEQIATGNNWIKRYYFAGWKALHEVSWASATESISHRWVYGSWIDEPLEYTDIGANPDKFYYYHEDQVGSIRVIADDQGVIKESYRYSEWGQTSTYDATFAAIADSSMSPVGNRWAFTGRQLEEDSAEAAYFYRVRHYDQECGRFLQRDGAIASDPMYNLYQYVANAPASLVDPFGEQYLGLANAYAKQAAAQQSPYYIPPPSGLPAPPTQGGSPLPFNLPPFSEPPCPPGLVIADVLGADVIVGPPPNGFGGAVYFCWKWGGPKK